MSEKRFELHSDEDTIDIIDLVEDEVFNFQFDVVSLSDAKILVLRLNRLAEENERLIEKRGELETKNVILKNENEQLRNELDNFKPVMFQDVRKGTVILYSKGD